MTIETIVCKFADINQYLHIIRKHPVYAMLFGLTALVYVFGLFGEILGLDATQYASISMEMSQTNDFLEIHHRGGDYLDKPPLHFWLSALSFKLFGLSNFAYRLPSFLVMILGTYSTFRLGKLLKNAETGRLAALMLCTSQAMFMINNDVRTDTLLTGFSVFGVWQLMAYVKNGTLKNLIWGSVGLAMAMLAKGPIGLMLPALALGTDFILRRDWKSFLKPGWLLMILIIGVILAPMVYGLYNQWDLHPEKTLYGTDNISGVKFYFWDQSFGRLTGDNPFINKVQPNQVNDPTFFIHTSLWAFLPWIFLALAGLFKLCKQAIQKRFLLQSNDGLLIGATVLPFLALSASEYKLPHYIFITYPFLAILSAQFLRESLQTRLDQFSRMILKALPILLGLGLMAMLIFVFPKNAFVVCLVLVAFLAILFYFKNKASDSLKPIYWCVGLMILVNTYMNLQFYPELGKYQTGKQASEILIKEQVPNKDVILFRVLAFDLEFHLGTTSIPYTSSAAGIFTDNEPVKWLYLHNRDLAYIETHCQILETHTFDSYPVTKLTLKFLNSQKRDEAVEPFYLLKVQKKPS